MTHPLSRSSDVADRAGRAAARAGCAGLVAGLTVLAAPALATPAEGFSDPAPVSAVQFLLVLVVIPAACALVISLLVVAPSLAKRGSGSSHDWESGGLWFGGPRGGIQAADEKALSAGRSSAPDAGDDQDADASGVGGASGRW